MLADQPSSLLSTLNKELSLAAAKTPFSNKWAKSQTLDSVEATIRFFDQPRSTADILDSIDEGQISGKPTRMWNAHFTDKAPSESPSLDESSQESFSDPLDDDLISVKNCSPTELFKRHLILISASCHPRNST